MSHTATVDNVPIKFVQSLRQCVEELKAKGLNIDLVENQKPRMYFDNQISKQVKSQDTKGEFDYNDDPDVCDYVLRVNDAYYDVGFLRKKDGSYTPIFDDYCYGAIGSATGGNGPIRDTLGAKFEGEIRHWDGRQTADESMLHSIGKLLQGYTKFTAIDQAVSEGYMVEDCIEQENGSIQLVLEVPE